MLKKFSTWLHYNLRYFGHPPWDTGISPPELIQYLQNTAPGKALDIGCGTGTNLLTMAFYGWKVVGVDLALVSVLKARSKLNQASKRGHVIHGNVTAGVRPGTDFDLALDIGCYHSLNLRERKGYQANLANWLKPGGCFLLYAHRKENDTEFHGISTADFEQFSKFLHCQWREDSIERRPDGGGGNPSCWALFVRKDNCK